MTKIALITGSTRTPRVGSDVASWVHSILKTRPTDSLDLTPLSIADFNLPVYDETVMPAMVPAMAQFTHEHSLKWSEAIKSYQGYVFVIPEYNAGLAGATKNAIDYLYHEVPGKPVAIVSYGTQGGKYASAQLSDSLGLVLKMKVVETKVLLPFAPGPDIMSAINEGVLGDESKKAWEEGGKTGEILKAWEEVKEVLAETKE